MKPITKQLIVSVFILTLVTVLSLGIRQVRFSAHRANTFESPVITEAEPDHYPAESHKVDVEPEPQYANASDWDVDAEPDTQYANQSDSDVDTEPDSKYANAWDLDKKAPFDYQPKPKSFKGDYAKSEGPKDLEKISLGEHENLYITGEGKLWYVSEPPDGKAVKMQVLVDDATGEMTIVSISDSGKSGGSGGLEKISLGDYENLYITGEGELWHVSEPPDGEGTKMQVHVDDTTGEIIVGEIIVVEEK